MVFCANSRIDGAMVSRRNVGSKLRGQRNFYKVEKWTKDGMRLERLV